VDYCCCYYYFILFFSHGHLIFHKFHWKNHVHEFYFIFFHGHFDISWIYVRKNVCGGTVIMILFFFWKFEFHKFPWEKYIHASILLLLLLFWVSHGHLISHTIPYENMSRKHLLNLYFHFKYFCHVASFILVFGIPFVCYLKAWIMRAHRSRIYHRKF